MNFNNVKLIFCREMRDQLRDRRTLFMIAVLPLLFYPLLGFSFIQIMQFFKGEPRVILVIGYSQDAGFPKLFGEADIVDKLSVFDERLLEGTHGGKSLQVKFADQNMTVDDGRKKVEDKTYVALVYFEPDFYAKLKEYQDKLNQLAAGENVVLPEVPKPQIISDERQESTALAGSVTKSVMQKWAEEVDKQTLNDVTKRPPGARKPVEIKPLAPVGGAEQKFEPSLWSKILPFVLLIWAVTGAFYPAVDLCAGEKERGTLETLLTSPAQRQEIVYGKLLTVMVFSTVTAVLNLFCMGLTGSVVMSRLDNLPAQANVGPPPIAALGWLVLMLIPISALFSAICLALAAFARSTKEGQYYLMPVILVTMPLILVPLAPSIELSFGTSLIPVTGNVLLMRATMEGTLWRLWPYAIPVAGVTLLCCWFATRWAVDQFSSESVLFREGERWDLGSWLKHLIRDRQPTPSVAMGVLCGVLILVLTFFLPFLIPPLPMGEDLKLPLLLKWVLVQMGLIALLPIVMSLTLTRNPARTLLLPVPMNLRSWLAIPAGGLLAVCLFPLIHDLSVAVQWVYPLQSPELEHFNSLIAQIRPGSRLFWFAWAVIALSPAICEELAFRGFVLSGLRHQGHKWRAIVFSALMFGVAHGILQQSITTSVLGCVLGYIAIQSGTLWTGACYHFTHNSIAFLTGLTAYKQSPWSIKHLQQQFHGAEVFLPQVTLAALLLTVLLLLWFRGFSYSRTAEEALQETIDQEAAHSMAG